jgi:hypothetical protein
MTPKRASQVFEFLKAKKSQTRGQSQIDPEERPLAASPDPAQAPSSRFSSYSSSAGSHESDIPSSNDTHTNHYADSHSHKTESAVRSVYNQTSPKWPSESNWLEPPPNRTRNRSTPTTMSCRTTHDGSNVQQMVVTCDSEAQSSRIPRNPRPLPPFPYNPAKSTPSQQHRHRYENLNSTSQTRHSVEQTHRSQIANASTPDLSVSKNVDVFTPILSRLSHRPVPSRSSATLTHASSNHEKPVPDLAYVAPAVGKLIQRKELKEMSPVRDKENQPERAVLHKAQFLPMTPVRSRSVFRAPVSRTPSPASSSDLSPVAQQLMADLRTQRMHAREREKKNGRWASTTSKLKW